MSVYKVIDIIGTSSTSWEDAATEAVRTAGQTIREYGALAAQGRLKGLGKLKGA